MPPHTNQKVARWLEAAFLNLSVIKKNYGHGILDHLLVDLPTFYNNPAGHLERKQKVSVSRPLDLQSLYTSLLMAACNSKLWIQVKMELPGNRVDLCCAT